MKYFIIAGEASGDLHAAALMGEIKKLDQSAEFYFMGGDKMQSQGGVMVKHYREMAYMGFISVVRNVDKVLRNFSDCKSALKMFKPDILILVDYPSFNLRIARFAKKHLSTSVYYYISPKIWAWKEYRINQIRKYIDKMYTIFPFETAFYAKHNFQVEYVGNPTVDSIAYRQNIDESFDEFCQSNSIPSKPIIALLSGSRKQEINSCLPKMLEAAVQIPHKQIIIAGAPGVGKEFYLPFLKKHPNDVTIVFNQTYQLLQQASVAVVNSGTATLETALIGTPQVVVYHVPLGKFAYFIKSVIIKIKYISLVNIVAQQEIVKELIAHLFTVKILTDEISRILGDDNYRNDIINGYLTLKSELGPPGAAKNAAVKMLQDFQLSSATL